jgi:hypothetical protein
MVFLASGFCFVDVKIFLFCGSFLICFGSRPVAHGCYSLALRHDETVQGPLPYPDMILRTKEARLYLIFIGNFSNLQVELVSRDARYLEKIPVCGQRKGEIK